MSAIFAQHTSTANYCQICQLQHDGTQTV